MRATDHIGFYLNIPHYGGLVAMRKALDAREDKAISTVSLIELVECVLENNIFDHSTFFCKQLGEPAIGTRVASPYAIKNMGDLEEQSFKKRLVGGGGWWEGGR